MKIIKKRIRNVEQYTSLFAQNEEIYIVSSLKDIDSSVLQLVGFTGDLVEGITILPKAVGPVSEYNANGKYLSHKDRPKETVYHSVWHRDWHGNYGFADMPYERYQRTYIPAPNVEITIIDNNGETLVATKGIENNKDNAGLIKHCINMFLELFGVCELLDKNLSPLVKNIPLKRVNWQILPEGKYPWKRLAKLAGGNGNANDNQGNFEQYRIETILERNPDEVCYGTGGFHGYLVFIFDKKNLVVMENIKYGNATYIFEGDWKEVSQMTKAEIIQEQLMKHRVLHQKGWKSQMRNLLK